MEVSLSRIFFFTFAAISTLCFLDVSAQTVKKERRFDRESFEAKRNAFITAEVGLTPEEAAQFIPLCNELRVRKYELGRECRKLSKEIKKKENPTDADYNRVLECFLANEMEEVKLEKEYFEQFKRILSPEKLYKYHEAELKFMRSFMKGGREKFDKEKQKN